MYRVNVAISNLRSDRVEGDSNIFKKDPLQEAQLLYNEEVNVLGASGAWTYIEAVEQKKDLLSGQWRGYQGWVLTTHLVKKLRSFSKNTFITARAAVVSPDGGTQFTVSFGTKFEAIGEEDTKIIVLLADNQQASIEKKDVQSSCIVENARSFLGVPYFWGGRSSSSFESSTVTTGLDCSGLTNLLYRVKGLDIPRNAVDQYTYCQKISGSELRPGDLIFSSPTNNPKKIDHVMIYTGEGQIIEARMGIGLVCVDTLLNRFGKVCEELDRENITSNGVLYYGRCLKN